MSRINALRAAIARETAAVSDPSLRSTDGVLEQFAELRRSGDPQLRRRLIERHLPLARSVAYRYRYTPQPLEDLFQVASVGLVKAVDAFDPERGTAFSTFAVPTILGELRHHMRDAGWAVHMPRTTKELVVALERAERTLSARLGGAPTPAQLAEEAGITIESVLEALTARVAHDAVPLDAPDAHATGGHSQRHSGPCGPRARGNRGAGVAVGIAAARGSRRGSRRSCRLRFIEEGRTQTEIAESRSGLSQMQVSRILQPGRSSRCAAISRP